MTLHISLCVFSGTCTHRTCGRAHARTPPFLAGYARHFSSSQWAAASDTQPPRAVVPCPNFGCERRIEHHLRTSLRRYFFGRGAADDQHSIGILLQRGRSVGTGDAIPFFSFSALSRKRQSGDTRSRGVPPSCPNSRGITKVKKKRKPLLGLPTAESSNYFRREERTRASGHHFIYFRLSERERERDKGARTG